MYRSHRSEDRGAVYGCHLTYEGTFSRGRCATRVSGYNPYMAHVGHIFASPVAAKEQRTGLMGQPSETLKSPTAGAERAPSGSGARRWGRRCRLLVLPLLLVVGACPECDLDGFTILVPSMRAEPTEIDLNSLPVAQDTYFQVDIFNPGNVTLNMDDVRFSDDTDPAFELLDWPLEVGPGERIAVNVKLRPVVVGTITGTLILDGEEAADPNLIEVPLRIEALDLGLPDIQVEPDEVQFGRIGEGDIDQVNIDVKNVGVRDLVIADSDDSVRAFGIDIKRFLYGNANGHAVCKSSGRISFDQ